MPQTRTIGTINVDYTANNLNYLRAARGNVQALTRQQRALRNFQRQLQRFNRSVRRSVSSLLSFRGALVAIAGTGGFGLLVRNAAQFGATLVETSRQLDVTIEQLQLLRRVAEGDGIAIGELDNALRQLTRRLGDAAAGNREYAEVFERLGIALRDAEGFTRNTFDVLLDAADALSQLPSAADRAAAAYDLFGRQGQRLQIILEQGRDAFEENLEAFARLGIVTTREGNQLKALEQTYTDLTTVVSTTFNRIAANLAPVFGLINVQLTNVIAGLQDTFVLLAESLRQNFDRIVEVFRLLVALFAGQILVFGIRQVSVAVMGLVAGVVSLVPGFSAVRTNITNVIAGARRLGREFRTSFDFARLGLQGLRQGLINTNQFLNILTVAFLRVTVGARRFTRFINFLGIDVRNSATLLEDLGRGVAQLTIAFRNLFSVANVSRFALGTAFAGVTVSIQIATATLRIFSRVLGFVTRQLIGFFRGLVVPIVVFESLFGIVVILNDLRQQVNNTELTWRQVWQAIARITAEALADVGSAIVGVFAGAALTVVNDVDWADVGRSIARGVIRGLTAIGTGLLAVVTASVNTALAGPIEVLLGDRRGLIQRFADNFAADFESFSNALPSIDVAIEPVDFSDLVDTSNFISYVNSTRRTIRNSIQPIIEDWFPTDPAGREAVQTAITDWWNGVVERYNAIINPNALEDLPTPEFSGGGGLPPELQEQLAGLAQGAQDLTVNFDRIIEGINNESRSIQRQIELLGLRGAALREQQIRQQAQAAFAAEELRVTNQVAEAEQALRQARITGNEEAIMAARQQLMAAYELRRLYNDLLPQAIAEYEAALGRAANEARRLEFLNRVQDFADAAGNAFGRFAEDVVRGVNSAEEAVRRLGQAIIDNLINNLVVSPISAAISAFLGVPGRQFGGIGRGLTLVGEAGPELVDFRAPGRVYTNEQLQSAISGGNTFNFSPVIQTSDTAALRAGLAEAYPIFRDNILADLQTNAGRNSQIRTALRG